jgi:hypothetical protein
MQKNNFIIVLWGVGAWLREEVSLSFSLPSQPLPRSEQSCSVPVYDNPVSPQTQSNEASWPCLKLLKLWAKINHSSVKLFHSGICHSYQKLHNGKLQMSQSWVYIWFTVDDLGNLGHRSGIYVFSMYSVIMWIIYKENIYMCSLCLKTERKDLYMVVHACSASYVGGLGTQQGWAKSETLNES